MATLQDLLDKKYGTASPTPQEAPAKAAPQAPASTIGNKGLPTTLPEAYSAPELKPVFTTDPDRQLEEFRVRTAALAGGVDPHLAAAVAQQESGFNRNAVSRTNVKGTMQVTQNTGRGLGYNRDDPDENVLAGVALLKKGLDANGGDLNKALSIYPDPTDAPKWIPAVLANHEKSKGSTPSGLDQAITNHFTQPTGPEPTPETAVEPTVGANPAPPPLDLPTAAVGYGQTGTYGQGVKGVAAVNAILQKLGLQKTVNSVVAPDQGLSGAYDANLKRLQEKQARAYADNPGSAQIGSVLATLFAPGKFGKGTSWAGKTGMGILEGGRQSAAMTAGLNPDATKEELIKNTLMGGAIGGVVSGALGGVEKYSNSLVSTNLATKDAGEYISNKFGFTKSIESLKKKVLERLPQTKIELDVVLKKAARGRVDLPKNMNPGDIREYADAILNHPDNLDDASRLYDISNFAKRNGFMTPDDAHFLKRSYQQAADYGLDPNNFSAGVGNRNFAAELKGNISNAVGPKVAGQLDTVNEERHMLGSIKKGIEKVNTRVPRPPRQMGVALAANTYGLSLIPKALETLPGGTGVTALAKSLPRPLMSVLNSLLSGLSEVEQEKILNDQDSRKAISQIFQQKLGAKK